jgi:hypothetical protein
MPTTSYPSSARFAATTELSTPPDIATTTLVSDGGFIKPRELSFLFKAMYHSPILIVLFKLLFRTSFKLF